MVLPVFDGQVVVARDGVAILGGFTASLEATPAIQIRHRSRGWQPIGSQLLDPRAGCTMTPLGDGRMLVVGGRTGSPAKGVESLVTAEVLNPFIAGSTTVGAVDEPLSGHTAHALGDSRAVVVGAHAVRLFDGERMKWIGRIPLAHPRKHHASVLIDDEVILVIGGDESGTVEAVGLRDAGDGRLRATTLWTAPLDRPLAHAAAARLPDGRVFVAGGVDVSTGRTIDTTWFIDPETKTVTPGPRLALERGVANAAMFVRDGKVAILGGEWIDADRRGPADAARLYDPVEDRLWALPPLPNHASRRMWFVDRAGRISALGGYLFIPPDEAARTARKPGVHLLRERITLRLGRLPVLED